MIKDPGVCVCGTHRPPHSMFCAWVRKLKPSKRERLVAQIRQSREELVLKR